MLPDMSKLCMASTPTDMKRAPNFGPGGWAQHPSKLPPRPEDLFDEWGRARRAGYGDWVDPQGRHSRQWYKPGVYHPWKIPGPNNRPFFDPNDVDMRRDPDVNRFRQTELAREQANRQAIYDRQLYCFNEGDKMLKAADRMGNGRWNEEYSKFWIARYAKDRVAQKDKDRIRDVTDKGWNNLRSKTPPPRKRVERSDGTHEYVVDEGRLRTKGTATDTSTLNDAEYANWRRGEEARIRRGWNITESQRRNPMAIPPASKSVDHMSPLAPERMFNYHTRQDLYYEVSAYSLYVLRVDVPGNWPDKNAQQRAAETERARVAEVARAAQEAADLAAREAQEAVDRAAREAADKAEAERQAKLTADAVALKEQMAAAVAAARAEYVGTPPSDDGMVLNDGFEVVPLHDTFASVFYQSICLLRHHYGRKPIEGGRKPHQIDVLRETAMRWINSTNVADYGNARRAEMLYSDETTFKQRLRGELQDEYGCGMLRAFEMLNKWRQRSKKWAAFTDWDMPLRGLPPPANANEQEMVAFISQGLLYSYFNSQNAYNRWPTMLDVEALAWSLPERVPIWLYMNNQVESPPGSDSWEFPRDAQGRVVPNWNAYEPQVVIGPPLQPGEEPYRLLWSGDDTMRFRPLIPRGESAATAPRNAVEYFLHTGGNSSGEFAPTTRDDRTRADVDQGLYAAEADPWSDMYTLGPTELPATVAAKKAVADAAAAAKAEAERVAAEAAEARRIAEAQNDPSSDDGGLYGGGGF